MSFPKIGPISSGTLNNSELAWAFAIELNNLAKRDEDDVSERRARTNKAAAAALDLLAADEPDEAALAEFVNETAPALFDEYCAPFMTFGALPGNSSEFGFWPNVDGVMEALREHDEVAKVDAGDEWPKFPKSVFYVVEVNDHGNVTLYERGTKKVIWACV